MADKSGKLDFQGMLQDLKNFDSDSINNIDWNDMGSWPQVGKLIFCILVFVGVILGGYFLLVSAPIEQLARESAREDTLKSDFENKAFRVSNLDAYKAQLAEMEESFGSLLKQLPRDTEVPGLIDDISAAALGAGLKLNAIDPEPMVRAEFYKELPIKIKVEGGYHEMGAFVSGVASLPRIVTLHDFSIESGSSGLSMDILAKTYQYGGEVGGGKR